MLKNLVVSSISSDEERLKLLSKDSKPQNESLSDDGSDTDSIDQLDQV